VTAQGLCNLMENTGQIVDLITPLHIAAAIY